MWLVRAGVVRRAARAAAAVDPLGWGGRGLLSAGDSSEEPDDAWREWTAVAARDRVREAVHEAAVAVRDWKGLGLVALDAAVVDAARAGTVADGGGRVVRWGEEGACAPVDAEAAGAVLRGLKARDPRFRRLAEGYEGARPVRGEDGDGVVTWSASPEAIKAWMGPYREAVEEADARRVRYGREAMRRVPEWFPLGVEVSQELELSHPIWAPGFPTAGQFPLGPVRLWEDWDEDYEMWTLGCSRGWDLGVAFTKLDEAIAYMAQYLETVQGMSIYHHPAFYPRVWAEELSEEMTDEEVALNEEDVPNRRFLVASFAQFWHRYEHLFPEDRTCHEMILDGQRCHMFLDVEFPRGVVEPQNELLDGNAAVRTVLNYLHEALRSIEDFDDVSIAYIAQADGSTPDKFSRHLVVHCVDGSNQEVVFSDTTHVGRLVSKAMNRAQLDASKGDYGPGPLAAQDLFLVPENSQGLVGRPRFHDADVDDDADVDGWDMSLSVVDMGVYAKNRTLRLVGSIKASTRVPLRYVRSLEVETLVEERRIAHELRSLHAPDWALEAMGVRVGDPAIEGKEGDGSIFDGPNGVLAAEAEEQHGILERVALEETLVMSLNRRDWTMEVEDDSYPMELNFAGKKKPGQLNAADLLAEAKRERDGTSDAYAEDDDGDQMRMSVAVEWNEGGPHAPTIDEKLGQDVPSAEREAYKLQVQRDMEDIEDEEDEEMDEEEEFDDADEDQDAREDGFDDSDEMLSLPSVVAHEGVRTDVLNAMPEELMRVAAFVLEVADMVAGKIEGTTSIRQCSLDQSGKMALFIVKDNRWCANIKREHVSNHIYFVVDFARAEVFQRCTDPTCEGYSSTPMDVPADYIPETIHVEPAKDGTTGMVEFGIASFQRLKHYMAKLDGNVGQASGDDKEAIEDEVGKVKDLGSEGSAASSGSRPGPRLDWNAFSVALERVQKEEWGDEIESEDDFDGEELEIQSQLWQTRSQTEPFDYSGLTEEEAAKKRAQFEQAAEKRKERLAKIFFQKKVGPSLLKEVLETYGGVGDEAEEEDSVDEYSGDDGADGNDPSGGTSDELGREPVERDDGKVGSTRARLERFSEEAINERHARFEERMANMFAPGGEGSLLPAEEQAVRHAEEFVREFKDILLWRKIDGNEDGFYDDNPLEDEIRDFKRLYEEFVVPMPDILADLRQSVLERKREDDEDKAAEGDRTAGDDLDPFADDFITMWDLPDAATLLRQGEEDDELDDDLDLHDDLNDDDDDVDDDEGGGAK